MSALRGLVGGTIALALLETALSSDAATNNASAVVTLATGAIARITDPSIPLIPDRRK